MTHPSNLPGPGEHHAPLIDGEPQDHLVPHGDQPAPADCEQDERRTQEMPSTSRSNAESDAHRHGVLRRTGTERDAMCPVRAADALPEQRLDHSAHDLQRETRLDPAQDNVGPQSDKS